MSVAEESLFTYLQSKSSVTDLVGVKVYPVLVDPRKSLPWIGYELTSADPYMSMAGESGYVKSRITITSWAASKSAARALSEALRNVLNGFRGTMGSMTRVSCTYRNEIDVIYEAEDNAANRVYGVQADLVMGHAQAVPTFS